MQDPDSSVYLALCTLNGNATIGVFANKASRSHLVDCALNDNGSTGCEARDRLTRMRLDACFLLRNKRVGLYSHSAATVAVAGCTVQGSGVKSILVGGRKAVDIGGGVVEYNGATTLAEGVMLRHCGRALLVEEFTTGE